ncbi:MAG TPA: hypothetical protein DD670_15915, partial [Planctomycetaceae bacterium]|nr:hypothetical protein [Planctomycetaceae bacterium]
FALKAAVNFRRFIMNSPPAALIGPQTNPPYWRAQFFQTIIYQHLGGGGLNIDSGGGWFFDGQLVAVHNWAVPYSGYSDPWGATSVSQHIDWIQSIAGVPERLPGDANGDGYVDAADAATLAAHWGQAGGWTQGDFNADGTVNAVDASILAANWCPSTPAEQASTGTVPEPSFVAMLTALLFWLGMSRRRSVGANLFTSQHKPESQARVA